VTNLAYNLEYKTGQAFRGAVGELTQISFIFPHLKIDEHRK
jgi:hypothetical protein